MSSNRNVGNYGNDVHFTRDNDAAFEFTFNGVGIDYVTEKFTDLGTVDIYIDDELVQTVDCYHSPDRLTKYAAYSVRGLASGQHKIKGVKKSGAYMLVDAFIVYQE